MCSAPSAFDEKAKAAEGPIGTAPTRAPTPLPTDRPLNASIPELADAVQEFLTDWLIRRNYSEALAFLAPDAFACVADSVEMNPNASPEQAETGRPAAAGEVREPVGPPTQSDRGHESRASLVAQREGRHARVRAGLHDRRGPDGAGRRVRMRSDAAPKKFKPTATPEYGTYYGALLQVVQEGRPGGTIVFVWRRVEGEWRLVAYRAVE